jgi:HlyD family secretion protein
MNRNSRLFLTVFVLIVGTLCSAGWFALNRTVSREKIWTGLVDVKETHLGPKIGGRLVLVGAEEGEMVSPGQVALELDRAALEDERNRAEAALHQAQGRRDEIIARRRQAEHDLRRIERLYRQGSASEHEYVQAQNALAALEGMLSAAEAAVQMHSATVERVGQELSETRVVFSTGGRVMMRAYEPGEVVPAGAPVLSVARMDPIWIYAFVDEVGVAPLKIGERAEWRAAHGRGGAGIARIVAIIPEAGFATQKDKGRFKRDIKTYRVKLEAANADETLKPGMTVDVVFDPELSD